VPARSDADYQYYVEWGVVMGDRIGRLRQDRHWALKDLAQRVPKPDGGGYSIGYFSRLERGWGNARSTCT
jgi:hypothetical protein